MKVAKSSAPGISAISAVPGERRAYEISFVNGAIIGTSKTTDLQDFKLVTSTVRLPDITLSFDVNGPTGQLYRLYKAAFARTPDVGGLGFWKDAMERDGFAIGQVAIAFLDSPESKATYGSNTSDSEFITRLYKNVLGRAPDADGFAFWSKALINGVKRPDILVAFAESAENKAAVADTMSTGMAYAEPNIAYIPVANAKGPLAVSAGVQISLDASNSTDANGDFLTYIWALTSQPPGSLLSSTLPASEKPKIILDAPGTYQFNVWAKDATSKSYSPGHVTVVAYANVPDTGEYLCYQLSAAQADFLYTHGHTYLDRNNDGLACSSADSAYEKAPPVVTVVDSGRYKCSAISHSQAVVLYLQGHTYLDRDKDGIPCEATDIAIETIVIAPPVAPPVVSSGMCWVNGYYRKNGTYVHGYWRHCP
jgi:hypothetical protein